MKNKLVSIKKIIEKEVGFRIDTRNKKREVTYARAVYCAVARGLDNGGRPMSLEPIGSVINRNYATVLHNVRVVFPFAMEDRSFRLLYDTLKDMFNDPKGVVTDEQKIRNTYEKIVELEKENEALKHKLFLIRKEGSKFDNMVDGLNKEELDEVYERLGLMVRSIKSRVYI